MADEEHIKRLISKAKEAQKYAYCRYSNFPVGAVIVTKDHKLYTGCNVENASYSVTVCAERSAIVKAVSEGHTEFIECAVVAETEDVVTPCGMCRQALREFGKDMIIHCANKDGKYKTFKLENDLLPMSFAPEALEEAQKHLKTF